MKNFSLRYLMKIRDVAFAADWNKSDNKINKD